MPHLELGLLLREIATLLTAAGDNVFHIRAYERAADTMETTPEDVAKLSKEGRLRELPGVGEGISKKILEWLETGKIAELEELRKTVNPAVLEIMRIPGVGPKKAKQVVEELGLTSVADLEKACKVQRVRPIKGFGAKTEANILASICTMRSARERTPLWQAREIAEKFLHHLKEVGGATELVPTGSLRRWKDSVRDLDVAAVAKDPAALMKSVTTMPGVVEVLGHGDTKTSVLYGQDRFQVDVRVVPKESFGAALQYFTGSKEHSVRLRERAQRMGLTVNEYGVFRVNKDGSKGERVAGATEVDVYEALGLQLIPPELREDRGELDAYAKGKTPPRLLLQGDIRGDLHTHSTWSDGTASIEVMALAAEKLGYEYMAVTDHSPTAAYAGGLTEERIKRQWDEIAQVQKKVKIRLLRGTEMDILPDGRLDWPDRILEQLDFVVASIHQQVKAHDRAANTRRIVSALQNPHVDLIGHPSTRYIGRRPALDFDWDEVFETAKKNGKALELNSSPERLDLEETRVRQAKSLGIAVFIDTDAHAPGWFANVEYGVMQARRAGLEPKDVINTRPLAELLKYLKPA